jgi:hypothetical protein
MHGATFGVHRRRDDQNGQVHFAGKNIAAKGLPNLSEGTILFGCRIIVGRWNK